MCHTLQGLSGGLMKSKPGAGTIVNHGRLNVVHVEISEPADVSR